MAKSYRPDPFEPGSIPPELTVVTRPGVPIERLRSTVEEYGARIVPLFRPSVRPKRSREIADDPDLSVYYAIFGPPQRLDELGQRLLREDTVIGAYLVPPAIPAVWLTSAAGAPPALGSGAPAANGTPNLRPRQIYLGPAPAGIDLACISSKAGGRGDGINVMDVEGEWLFEHEDLLANQGGAVIGAPLGDPNWRNHGTAVQGIVAGDDNGVGILGICPNALFRGASVFFNDPMQPYRPAAAIRDAADFLSKGDIIMILVHRAGPRFNFAERTDRKGYIAIEWFPENYDAIRYATGRGIIVVEAAANGGEDLDDPIYDVRPTVWPAVFPATWRNPFPRNPGRDSRAIVVGAGAPPPGVHGRNNGVDRSRLEFSNYGSMLDAQGWGREVTTSGYGFYQGGLDERRWYTDDFGGTSSATPMVAGLIACLQGVQHAAGRPAAG